MAAMRQWACERCDAAMASAEWPDEALCPRCQHAAVGLSEGVGILPNGFFAERLRKDKDER